MMDSTAPPAARPATTLPSEAGRRPWSAVARRATSARRILAGAAGPLVVLAAIIAAVVLAPLVGAGLAYGDALASLAVVAVGVGTIRTQRDASHRAAALAETLAERERAFESVPAAARVLATSEVRHRLLLDAAVDGVVELEADGTIVRTNRAFARMVRMPTDEVVGARWPDLAARADPSGSLATLPETCRAVLVRPTGTVYLEASTSEIPGTPPGTLLLIRDTTAGRIAEQTVRALLQFLQDRDEDRTRLLRRPNATIEGERNRIARDLHDGPIQGVSAAALSLEAVRLMLASNDVARAKDTVEIICRELAQEAINLRRIMSDLRPPVLEERGLIPAVRELSARITRELQIPVTVEGGQSFDIPPDIETLAYRVVQESLSNVAKHADATGVAIRVETSSGTVTVEVADDGRGFDPSDPRAFLRDGKVGLASMRERAELAGGTFTNRSGQGRGTIIRAVLPFDVLAAAARISRAGLA